ncbi:MAG: carboxypeptidase regulatory-like domain-containing protein, partial [Myxococcales bacterium]|nr:carboxypeptidase regulatory-like domain-containing protein [Myxococcales bacterium]
MDDGTPCSLGIIELRHEHLEIERTANVGDDGEAVVDGLPRGPYEARAQCPEGTLAIGPEHLQIEEDAAAQWTFAIGGAVVGEVTRAGNPAPSVTVTALPDGAAPVVTITDVDGRFRLSGLSTRTYSLWAGQGDDESEAIEVEVIAGREPRVALQLGDASVVEGIAQDAEGRPCAGAAVLLTRGPRRQRVNADARGWFSFGAQAPGEAEVALLDQDEQAFDRQELALRGDALPSLKLRCSPRDASLRGVIQDHEGDPVRDALVEATPLVAGEPDFAATSASTLSDAEGSFVIAGLATGSYRVTGRTIAGVEIASTSAATGEPVVLIAGPRASVAGSVRGEVAGPVLITLRRPSDGSTRTAR